MGYPVRIIETGEEFESLSYCAGAIGGDPGPIRDVLDGKRKSYRGFTFEQLGPNKGGLWRNLTAKSHHDPKEV